MSEHIDRFTLEAYVEKALPAMQRRGVEAHVTTCPTCQARLAAAKQMTALLYELPRERPAPELAARINAAITAHARGSTLPGGGQMDAVAGSCDIRRWTWSAGAGCAAVERVGQAAATAQLPTDQAILNWLGNLCRRPGHGVGCGDGVCGTNAHGRRRRDGRVAHAGNGVARSGEHGRAGAIAWRRAPRMAAAAVSVSG